MKSSIKKPKEIVFKNLPRHIKKLYLELLGYSIDDEDFITDEKKKRVKCEYSLEYIQLKTASILPGSTIIINTSPYTLSSYISDHLAEK